MAVRATTLPPIKPLSVAPDAVQLPALASDAIEQMRFGLASAGPLTQSVLNNNANGVVASLPVGVTAEAGMIMLYARSGTWQAPAGWLECNGAAVTEQTYPKLYSVVGATLPNIPQISANIRYVVKW